MARTTKSETPLARILREEGRKQVWLAERTGIDAPTLNRIVHGLHASDARRQAIADALGRKVGELWPGNSERAA